MMYHTICVTKYIKMGDGPFTYCYLVIAADAPAESRSRRRIRRRRRIRSRMNRSRDYGQTSQGSLQPLVIMSIKGDHDVVCYVTVTVQYLSIRVGYRSRWCLKSLIVLHILNDHILKQSYLKV